MKKNGYIVIDEVTQRRAWFTKYNRYLELQSYDNKTKADFSEFYKIQGSLERFAKNYRIQGTSGSMTKFACFYFFQELEKRKISTDEVFVVNLIHDEIVAECPIEMAELVGKLLTHCMVKAGKLFCKTIPMVAHPVITQHWVH